MDKKNNGEKNGKLANKEYMKELRRLQAELCKLQDWVKHRGIRAVIVFEGRDAAGKGGTIRAITERVSPRIFRVVALRHRRIARNPKCTCSATCSTFPGQARS